MSTYTSPDYDPVSEVTDLRRIPRFGHTSNFADFASDSEQDSYVQGLLFVPLCIGCFFTLWTIALVVWKFMGHETVGFLSGHHFVQPNPNKFGFSKKSGKKNRFRRPSRARAVFCLCALIVIAAAFFMVMGIDVEKTVNLIKNSNSEFRTVLIDGEAVIASMERVGFSTLDIFDALEENNATAVCQAASDQTGLDLETLLDDATAEADAIEEFFTGGDFAEIQEAVVDLLEATEDIDEASDESDEGFELYTYILVHPLMVMATLLMVAAIWSGYEVSCGCCKHFVACFIMPLFTLWVTATWIATGVLAAAAIVNADFCSGDDGDGTGSPDGTILEIVEREQEDDDGKDLDALRYYVGGCTTDNPFDTLDEFDADVQEAERAVDTILANITSGSRVATISVACEQDLRPAIDLLAQLGAHLDTLGQNTQLALSLTTCERINSLYVKAFHDGVCGDAVQNLSWMFAAMFVASVAGMIMVTLRAACYETEFARPGMWEDELAADETVSRPVQDYEMKGRTMDHHAVSPHGAAMGGTAAHPGTAPSIAESTRSWEKLPTKLDNAEIPPPSNGAGGYGGGYGYTTTGDPVGPSSVRSERIVHETDIAHSSSIHSQPPPHGHPGGPPQHAYPPDTYSNPFKN